jgi:adenosine deaminase
MLQRGIARLLLTAAGFFVFTLFAAEPASIEHRFAELKKNPPRLYAFLYKMPKGADLHSHLSGAVYAESFLETAADRHLCVDRAALALLDTSSCRPGQPDAATIRSDNDLRNALIDSFSMRNFVPGKESGHDHFFDTFNKFGALSSGEFVSEIARRAADQNESYVELMALSGGSVNALGASAGFDGNFEASRQKLEAAGLAKSVANLKDSLNRIEQTRIAKLGCRDHADSAACRVEIGYVYQVLREFPKEQVFAQVLAGFALAASDPRVVAINFVQAEDGYHSMTDYHLHMQMVDFAKKIYPAVHITLHAGELAPGLVPPEGLLFHIREAVELGHAERIGHGVDLMYETDPESLLREMRDRHIDVEINLTSNDGILGVKGDQHPFQTYRRAGVPVSLSTDDEGVNRSDLTEEFVRAVETYNLSWADLKELVRNSIEYSFAPGASYWKDRRYTTVVSACAAGRRTADCHAYLEKNEKARLGADLEERFAAFERNTN